MKKLITGVCFAAILLCNMVYASDSGSVKVFLDNEEVSYDEGPLVTDNGPLIPLRFTIEEMGGEVKWNSENKSVYCDFDGIKGSVKINSVNSEIDENQLVLDEETIIFNGRTMVDSRFIEELTGMNIIIDKENMNIIISDIDGGNLDVTNNLNEKNAMKKSEVITDSLGESPLDKVFSKRKDVFGVKIFASDGVSDANFNHAVNIMAEYLDNNEDGISDNKEIVDKLLEKEAAMILFKNENEEEEMMDKYGDIFDRLENEDSLQNLYNNEIHINGAKKGRFDASYEEILHLITHVGYANVYPSQLGEKPGSEIADAMDLARGGQFIKIPKKYPEKAWYSYYDDTADYSTMVTEYVYWSLTSILGAQEFDGRYEDINEEWKLNTKDKVMNKDIAVYKILTNDKYNLPTRLPDGKYEVK